MIPEGHKPTFSMLKGNTLVTRPPQNLLQGHVLEFHRPSKFLIIVNTFHDSMFK